MQKNSVAKKADSVYERFKCSYGGWNGLAMFLRPIQFLKMQALCKYTYRVSISRVQTSWFVRMEDFCALALPIDSRLEKTVFFMQEADGEKRLVPVTDQRFKLQSSYPIVVGKSLVVLSTGVPNTVTRYDNLNNLETLETTLLHQMRNDQEIAMFTLTTFWNRFVLFSGGQYRKQLSQGALKSVYLLDTVTGQWLNYHDQPQLTQGRSHHSSCSTRDKFFLFGGME